MSGMDHPYGDQSTVTVAPYMHAHVLCHRTQKTSGQQLSAGNDSPTLCHCGFPSRCVVAAEDAAGIVMVVELGTQDSSDAVGSHIPFSG